MLMPNSPTPQEDASDVGWPTSLDLGWRYELSIIQQPVRARACGNTTKDYRTINPSPILQLVIQDDAAEMLDLDEIDYSRLTVTAALDRVSDAAAPAADLDVDVQTAQYPSSLPPAPARSESSAEGDPWSSAAPWPAAAAAVGSSALPDQRGGVEHNLPSLREVLGDVGVPAQEFEPTTFVSKLLWGNSTSCAHLLMDTSGQSGLFFFFNELGVRGEGQYRLQFRVYQLEMEGQVPSTSNEPLAEATSDVFTVYSSKRFPGTLPTTKLSKHFSLQNIKSLVS